MSAPRLQPPADHALQPKRPAKASIKASGIDTQPSEGKPAAGLRVLFIENDEAVVASLGRLLELEGFRVECVADCEAALVLTRGQSYDAILLDLRFPRGMSGVQFLQELRRDGDWTPVLILTGFPDADSAFETGVLRAVGYLKKGLVSGAEIAAALRKAATPVALLAKKLTLFCAYGGRSSRSFLGLLSYLANSETNPPDLIRALVRVVLARDLTFVEFRAAARSLHLLHSKVHLPFSAVLPKIREWLEETTAARSLDSRLEDVLGRLEAAGKDWPKFSVADLPSSCKSERGAASELFAVEAFARVRRTNELRPGDPVWLSDDYLDWVGEMADRQLVLAGSRLAGILNAVFAR